GARPGEGDGPSARRARGGAPLLSAILMGRHSRRATCRGPAAEATMSDGDLAVFTGNAHPQLARDICAQLKVPLGNAEVTEFSNENIWVKINENVRGKDVFVVQPFTTPVSTSILELIIMIDALKRASARRITAVIPHYASRRTAKKDPPRPPIT